MKKMVIPGGSGFLGRTLARWFESRGWEVVILTRHANEEGYEFRHPEVSGALEALRKSGCAGFGG